MNLQCLKELRTTSGKAVAIRSHAKAAGILENIRERRETRLLFETMADDDDVVRLLTTHARVLSPVEILADELRLPGEFRGPLVRYLPVPLIVDLHGGESLSERDLVTATASASVDAKILWDKIRARMYRWMDKKAASAVTPDSTGSDALSEDSAPVSFPPPEEVFKAIRTALENIDSAWVLNGIAKGVSNMVGGEALPLLRALPLLPLGFVARVGLRHRERVMAASSLDDKSMAGVVRRLAQTGAIQVGFSLFCCRAHEVHPFAFMALGQEAPPEAICPTCQAHLPGITYYHFEPVMSTMLRRQGGILEPLVWSALAEGGIPFAPLCTVGDADSFERDAVFQLEGGEYGVVECKVWVKRADEESRREQLRRVLAQMEKSVDHLRNLDIPVGRAILVSNRYEDDLSDVLENLIEEHGFKALRSVGTHHLGPKEVWKLQELGKSKSSVP